MRFRDPQNGIEIERRIFAKEGVHHKLSAHVSHASMDAHGAWAWHRQVFLDGKFKGHAPLPSLEFFEGRHDIKVKMGQGRLSTGSSPPRLGEALTLDVRPTAE